MTLQFVRNVWKDMIANGGVEKVLFPGLTITHAEPGIVKGELKVEQKHLNRLGSMHGGVLSTLVDIGGSLAVASHNRFQTGVSTDISTTFISAAGKPGDTLNLLSRTDRLGRTMAFTTVELSRDGKLVAKGNHTKFVPSPKL